LKILSPVDKVDEVEELIQAGANELYCGVLSEEWWQEYTIAAVNRRIARACNFKSFDELKKCLAMAHSYNVPVSLTVNEHYYIQEQYPMLLDYLGQAMDAGIDSLLISDMALLLYLKEAGIKIPVHISIGGTVFNSKTAGLYQSLGASRITLPRHITINEVRDIVTGVKGIETGVFILNSRCPNADGFCTFLHMQSADPGYKNACMLPYTVEVLKPEPDEVSCLPSEEACRVAAAISRQQVWARHHMDEIPCGACAIYDFNEMGVDYVKIVGRGNQTWRKVVDITFIRMLLAFLGESGITAPVFREKAQALYNYTYRRPCRTLTCYYPEVLSLKTGQLANG